MAVPGGLSSDSVAIPTGQDHATSRRGHVLRSDRAMSGTDVDYAARAVSGTDVGLGPYPVLRSAMLLPGGGGRRVGPRGRPYSIGLRACYAVSGTDLARGTIGLRAC
eukprot:2722600-Rhodomonas_salina.2